MIYGNSTDPVLIKKIELKIWTLRDELEAVIATRYSDATNPPTIDDLVVEYNAKGEIALADEGEGVKDASELDDFGEDEMAKAIAQAEAEEAGEEESTDSEDSEDAQAQAAAAAMLAEAQEPQPDNVVKLETASVEEDGKVIVIVPQSSMVGKSKEEKTIKANILKKHTLEGVITLNKNTFYGVGTNPCIAIFTAGVPHYKDKEVKFVNYENDGFEVQKHRGLIETINAKDRKQHLLDIWFNKKEAETKFCVKTTIEDTDEWLHSFYYFNDEIPTDIDFEKTIADYLTFEFNMVAQGRSDLFKNEE